MSARRRRKNSKKSGLLGVTNLFLLLIYTILTVLTVFTMYFYQFLNFRHVNIIYSIVLGVVFCVSLMLIILKKARLFTTVILSIFLVIIASTLLFFKSTIDVTGQLNKTASFSEIEMSIVVPKDSDISDLSQVTKVQAPLDSDKTNIDSLLAQIKEKQGLSLPTESVASYQVAYDNLIKGGSSAMVLSSAYSSLLELSHPDYASKLKTVYTYKVTKSVEAAPKKETHADVFNIYVSGIDTYGPISSVSRSDVNIIMTVNTKTHKILLTTTPRDSYVQIPDGGNNQYDKLTHAGIYGVDTSIHTLENLYGITMDYYARINFTSFLTLIDKLGGIEVYNDQAFTSWTNNKYSFPVGNVTLNSEQALAFVRERYSLQNGDNDRGKNQEKVIAAIINKLASLQSLSNFTDIINALSTSVQTNMPLSKMTDLANQQLESGGQYTVVSQAITGAGSTGELKSYAMPTSSLYMLSIDQASLDTAKQAINDTMEGR